MAIRRPWTCIQIAVISLLVALPSSLQVPSNRPRGRVAEQSNEFTVGLITSYEGDISTLTPSDEYELISTDMLYGRTFYTVRFNGIKAVCVEAGPRRMNAGIAVQILMDTFKVNAIIQYGTAVSANASLSYGDVSVPNFLFQTGCLEWLRFEGKEGASTQVKEPRALQFQDFGIGNPVLNRLQGLRFKREVFFSEQGMDQEAYGVPTERIDANLVPELQKLNLQECVETTCVDKTPKVVVGLRGSTSDIFIDNEAYANYLAQNFKVSTLDEESAAVAMGARAGDVPVYVFLGVSDRAGYTEYSTSLPSLPAINARKVALAFMRLRYPSPSLLQSVV